MIEQMGTHGVPARPQCWCCAPWHAPRYEHPFTLSFPCRHACCWRWSLSDLDCLPAARVQVLGTLRVLHAMASAVPLQVAGADWPCPSARTASLSAGHAQRRTAIELVGHDAMHDAM